jgi:uncharacterized protein
MPASPCINICRMDPDNEFCLGCFRTLDEIANWSRSDEQTQDHSTGCRSVIRREAQATRQDQSPK